MRGASSQARAGDLGLAPWTHARPRASVCQLPSTMEERFPAAPNEQRMPHHTSAEDGAWRPYVNLSSCIAAYSPEYPTQSWSRTSSFGQPGVRRAEIQAPFLPVSASERHEMQNSGMNRKERIRRRVRLTKIIVNSRFLFQRSMVRCATAKLPLLFTEIYKTLPGLTNLYRTLRAPVLKSNHCTQAIKMIVAVAGTIRSHNTSRSIYESRKV